MKTARDAGSPNSQMPSLNKRRVTTSTPTYKTHIPSNQNNGLPSTYFLNILIQMKSNGKTKCSIKNTEKLLEFLNQHTDLNYPDQVKNFIANHNVTNGTKRNIVIAYKKFCEYYKIEWTPPIYKQEPRPRRIPTREKLQKLISSASTNLSIKLQISMETGLRPVELCNLKVKDFDSETRTIYPTTAKYGASRTLRTSNNLQQRLTQYIIQNHLTEQAKLFYGDSNYYQKQYRTHRNKLSTKLKETKLRTIRLYDFRHYFATNLYNKTKDILLVKQQMGHKKLDTTLIYTQLLNLNEDEWTCRTANNVKQASELIENGFQYVTEMEGRKLFRKRK